MGIILASQSPRRRELLDLIGLTYTVRVANIDETMDPSGDPAAETARVSRAKALAVAMQPEDIVIAADTIVVCQGQVLGKPTSPEHASQMLRLLSGRMHEVITGFTIRTQDSVITDTESSQIYFRPLEEEEILAYVDTGEPMDKAGAYGIQGKGALFVSRLEGDFYNVMGLPVCALAQRLRTLGVKFLGV